MAVKLAAGAIGRKDGNIGAGRFRLLRQHHKAALAEFFNRLAEDAVNTALFGLLQGPAQIFARAARAAPRLAPRAEQLAHEHELPDVVGVVVGNQQRFA